MEVLRNVPFGSWWMSESDLWPYAWFSAFRLRLLGVIAAALSLARLRRNATGDSPCELPALFIAMLE